MGIVSSFSTQAQMISKGSAGVTAEKEKKISTAAKKTSTAKPYLPLVGTVDYDPISKPVFGSFAGAVKSITAGGDMIMASKEDGTTWAWGYYQLETYGGPKGLLAYIPAQVFAKHQWKKMTLASSNFYGIREDGTLWTLGKSNAGQLGTGITSTDDKYYPLTLVGKETDWLSITNGNDFAVALKKDGTVWGWGFNQSGQLGNEKFRSTIDVPMQLNSESNWSMISASRQHVLALKKDGSLWGWGGNYLGVLGVKGEYAYKDPVQVGIDTDWVLVSTHTNSSFGIKQDGSLWAWGGNASNNLGLGEDKSPRFTPVRFDHKHKWKKVHTSGEQTIALDENGRAWVWGFMVGSTPQMVSADMLFKDVYSGGRCFFGIKEDGTLWVWTHDTSSYNRCIGVAVDSPQKLGKQPRQITQTLIGF